MIPDLRLQNILQSIGQPSPTSPDVGTIDQAMLPSQPINQPISANTTDPDSEQEMMHRLQMMFNPSYAMQQQLQQHIASMPQRAQYQPGKMRQIAGILANLGTASPSTYQHGAALGFNANIPEGIAAQRAINEAPYNRAMIDWEAKLAPLEKIAGIESAHNVNERNIANEILGRSIQMRNLKRLGERDIATETEKKREALEKEDIARQSLKVREARAKTYEAKAHGATIRINDNGDLVGTDPTTLKSQILTYDDGTAIKSQHLSDVDKINLEIEGRLKTIGATGIEQRKTEETKQTGRATNIGARGEQARATKAAPTAPKPTVTSTIRGPKGEVQLSKTVVTGDEKLIQMKDKNGKLWNVKESQVEAFKKANGIK